MRSTKSKPYQYTGIREAVSEYPFKSTNVRLKNEREGSKAFFCLYTLVPTLQGNFTYINTQ